MDTPSIKSLCLEIFDGKCCYCGIELDISNKKKLSSNSFTQDHFIPQSKLERTYHRLNIVPSCRSCNDKKGSMNPEEFATQESIDNIMSYFNYVYYVFKRFRFAPLGQLNKNYNNLWKHIGNFTTIRKIKVEPERKKKRK